jgi:hypothetical protein
MSKDYIPATHANFYVWQGEFFKKVSESASDFNIDEAKVTGLSATKTLYETAFQRAANADGANRSDRVERDKQEAAYKSQIRGFVNENLRYNSLVSDYDRQYLGLTVADSKPTAAAIPATSPVLTVDFSQPQKHTISIQDSASARKTKPAGVMHCEIWRKQGGEAPVSDSDLSFAGSATKSTFVLNYDGALSGTRIYYKARWVNTRGEAGSFGVMATAVIG